MSIKVPPISVRPIFKIDLSHRVTGLTSTPNARRMAVANESLISILEFEQNSVRTIALTAPVRELKISRTGSMLGVVNHSKELQVVSLEIDSFGQQLISWAELPYDICVFSESERQLWAVAAVSDDSAEINCFDTKSWQLLGKLPFKPLIRGCSFWLTPHPKRDLLSLWACGGPDELWNYWIYLTEDGIELQQQPELNGATPPSFNTLGDRFVVLDGYELKAFSFPECSALSPPMTFANDDDTWAESMCYLDSPSSNRVVAATNEARIFVADLERAELVAEITLEGHEPQPCYQVYTALAKDNDGLCTDLDHFFPAEDNRIVSVHTNGRVSNREDSILIWDAPVGE